MTILLLIGFYIDKWYYLLIVEVPVFAVCVLILDCFIILYFFLFNRLVSFKEINIKGRVGDSLRSFRQSQLFNYYDIFNRFQLYLIFLIFFLYYFLAFSYKPLCVLEVVTDIVIYNCFFVFISYMFLFFNTIFLFLVFRYCNEYYSALLPSFYWGFTILNVLIMGIYGGSVIIYLGLQFMLIFFFVSRLPVSKVLLKKGLSDYEVRRSKGMERRVREYKKK